MTNQHLVIMAGGIGSRFWPLSDAKTPKQFLDILGTGRTLIQLTLARFEGIIPIENVWVVTSEEYTDLVRQQLPEVLPSHILSEPERRNTAPQATTSSQTSLPFRHVWKAQWSFRPKRTPSSLWA